MNKKERLIRAFNNEEVDRVPAGFWFHFPEDKCLGEEGIKQHIDYYKAIDADFMKLMCDGYFDYPNEVAKSVTSVSDWYKMKPLGKNHPFIREQVERCKAINEQLQGECCTFYNVFNPMSSLRFATSEELLMAHLKQDEKAIWNAFDVIAEDAATLSQAVIEEGGCDGIYFCVQNAEKNRFTIEEYVRIVAPSEKRVLDHVNKYSENNILHCCGWAGDKNNLEVWKDYNAKVFNWAVFVEEVSLLEGKQLFGGKAVLGGFDNRPQGVLLSGTREEVEQFTKELIEKTGKQGIILGGDCTFPRGVDVQRFKWVLDTLQTV